MSAWSQVERDHIDFAILRERARQHQKWGDQSHLLDGTGGPHAKMMAEAYRERCDAAFERFQGTFAHLLLEEVFEACAESDPDLLMLELIQCGALIRQWIEVLHKRGVKARLD
jgi:hypothetical protein